MKLNEPRIDLTYLGISRILGKAFINVQLPIDRGTFRVYTDGESYNNNNLAGRYSSVVEPPL